MGCGKSSVGRELSRLLCCPFMDLDSVIENRAGRSVPEIFTADGEARFRQMELETLQDLVCRMPICNENDIRIVALGGGTVMTEGCAEIVREQTRCVYLKAGVETLISHLEGATECRPMLSGEEYALRSRIEKLMAVRSDTYEKTAHITIDTDGKSIEEITQEILEIIPVLHGHEGL